MNARQRQLVVTTLRVIGIAGLVTGGGLFVLALVMGIAMGRLAENFDELLAQDLATFFWAGLLGGGGALWLRAFMLRGTDSE